jgi:rod shape-determining protein MreB and related proteins
MPICRSSGPCEMWENEFYKHPAPLALRTDNVDSNDLLFAHSSGNRGEVMNNMSLKRVLQRFWRASLKGINLVQTEDLAIDLGTANTRIYLPGEGVVINEPSVIAFDTGRRRVVAVGEGAKVLAHRQLRTVRVVCPIKDGVISDCEVAGRMLSLFIRRALNRPGLPSPTLLICVPADITQMEQKAYEEAAKRAGAVKVKLIEEPYAAAAGAGLNLRAAPACMIVDLGAATTDIAVISGGSVLYASTRCVGGDEMDRAIAHYLHHERRLEVSERTAEAVKIELGTVGGGHTRRSMAVRGRNLATGLPDEIAVTSEEIHPLIKPALRVIKHHVHTALEEIPTEASVDLIDSGISLSGGLSQLPGLAEHLGHELGLCVRVVPDPMLAAVIGAGCFLEQKSHASTLRAMKRGESAEADERRSSLAGI